MQRQTERNTSCPGILEKAGRRKTATARSEALRYVSTERNFHPHLPAFAAERFRPLALLPAMRPRPIQEGDDKNGTEPQQSLKKIWRKENFVYFCSVIVN